MNEPNKGPQQKAALAGISLLAALMAVKSLVEGGPSAAMASPLVEVPSVKLNATDDEALPVVIPQAFNRTEPLFTKLKCDPFSEVRSPALESDSDTLSDARSLELKSILYGGQQGAICVINNLLVRETQSVEGFVVDKIGDSSVIVHRGKYRFELRKNHASN